MSSSSDEPISIKWSILDRCDKLFTNEALDAISRMPSPAKEIEMEGFVRRIANILEISPFLADIVVSLVYESRKVDLGPSNK